MCHYLKQGNRLINISGVLKIHLIPGVVACGGLCHPHQRVGFVDQLLSCFLLFCLFQSVVLYAVSSLSLATVIMYIPVSPGFWKIYPMILE